jgi:hypothetical protein
MAPNSKFMIHGFIMCAHCKNTIAANEPEDQDLFDDDFDMKRLYMDSLRDVILRN